MARTAREFWVDVLTSGMPRRHSTVTTLRIVLVNSLCLVGSAFVLAYGLYCYRQGEVPLMILQFTAVALLWTLAAYLRVSKNYRFGMAAGVGVAGSLCLGLLILGGQESGLHLWTYTFPLLAVFLLGLGGGAVASFALLTAEVAFFIGGRVPMGTFYSADFKVMFVGSYLGVGFLVLFLEYMRIRFETVLTSKNADLQAVSDDLRDTLRLLRVTEMAFESLIERAPDGIVLIQDEEIKLINPSLASVGGYAAAEVVGTSIRQYLDPSESKETFANYMLRMRDVPVPEVYRSALQDKDGQRIAVEIRARKVMYKGLPADLVFVRPVGGSVPDGSAGD